MKILLVGADGTVARCVGSALLPDYDLGIRGTPYVILAPDDLASLARWECEREPPASCLSAPSVIHSRHASAATRCP